MSVILIRRAVTMPIAAPIAMAARISGRLAKECVTRRGADRERHARHTESVAAIGSVLAGLDSPR